MDLSILGNHQQPSNKTMKNEDENKNKNNESYEFIHSINDMLGPLYIFRFSMSNRHTLYPKREYK